MDSDVDKNVGENLGNAKRRNSQLASGAHMFHSTAGAEPDNKYYEVEAILDGPRKRREHLFKLCYKVRWKGYGPEADTWQPIADLANVQDMIDDFKKERAMKQREKGKKFIDTSQNEVTRGRTRRQVSDDDDDSDDDDKLYDPVYGTVKDKFWKDLELGRHQNHAQLFSGDMYSKVKGCRRAAHAEAVASIQRQQQLQSKSLTSHQPSPAKHVRGGFLSRSKSASAVSSKSFKSLTRSKSPKATAVRAQKRAHAPFSARGYMSAKRSRRSREAKSGNPSPEGKRSRVNSVTSETMGLVTTSHPVSPTVESNILESLQSSSSTANSSAVQSDRSPPGLTSTDGVMNPKTVDMVPDADAENDLASDSQETISSDSQSAHIVENVSRDAEIMPHSEQNPGSQSRLSPAPSILAEVSTRQKADENCKAHSHMTVGASGTRNTSAGTSSDANGATSGGAAPGPSVINKNLPPRRSPLDAQSEASGAVERSHDEECLWNGACNRSDCKSNRRRNMKNGQRKGIGVRKAETYTESHIAGDDCLMENDNQNNGEITAIECENHGIFCENMQLPKSDLRDHHTETEYEDPEVISERSSVIEIKSSSNSLNTSAGHSSSLICTYQHSSSSKESYNPTPSEVEHSTQQLSQKTAGRLSKKFSSSFKASSSSQSCTSGQVCKSLMSPSHTDVSDLSFNDSPSGIEPFSRETVGDTTSQVDLIAHHLNVDAQADSAINKIDSLDSSVADESTGNSAQSISEKKSSAGVERPGLFSDSYGAFTFTRQDSGFSGGSGSATPGEQHGQFMLSPAGSINHSSPGKENFGSLTCRSSGLIVPDAFKRLQVPMDVNSPIRQCETSSPVQSSPFQHRIFLEPSDGRPTRKWSNEVPQPLEKVSSPNLQDSDLDRQISTLTCDELEDFVEQGEQHYCQKDVAFISDADLLQAVNLNKAEVVKHAIRQNRLTEQKLDFNQPDITGLTLLMRAVQKGNIAIVEMLLEHGVNVNAQQTSGVTALMIAAEQNALCLVALLLKYGANSSIYTVHSEQAETALMKAIKRQHREVVNLMLRVGVNIAAPTCTSLSALELAIERRNPHIERIIQLHCQRLEQAFQSRVLATLEGTADLVEPLFPMQCFPLRESHQFVVKFNSSIHPVKAGEGFLLFIAHTKITENMVRCRIHGGCPIGSVTLNGIVQSPLTKEINFVTSCHPVVPGCNILIINKQADYTSKAKLVVQAFRARLLPC